MYVHCEIIRLFISPSSLSDSEDGSYNEHGREIFDEEIQSSAAAGGGGGGEKKTPAGGGGGVRVSKKVARPGNIKAMVMGMGGGTKKRKEVTYDIGKKLYVCT